MSRLPQLLPGQQAIAWYQSGLFWAGIAIVVIALLILIVPPRHWKHTWYSVRGLPRRFCTACIWWCYGPKYNIYGPIFKSEVSEIGQGSYKGTITASIWVWIKSKNKPLRVNFSSANVCLEQRVGWEQRNARFRLDTGQGFPEVTLKPHEEWHEQILVSLGWRGGNRDSFPDTQKRHHCGVWGIWVTLPKADMRQLHKGADCHPSREQIFV